MQAGRYNRKIALEAYTETRDEYGGVIESWVTELFTWASIRSHSPREVFQSDQTQNYKTTIFIIRYSANVDEKMRVVHEGKVYNISGLSGIGRRKELQIIAEWDGNTDNYVAGAVDTINDGTVY